ncbi:alpha/beta hydrolase family protein [Thermostaphylospora chromogena]|uniref:Alpha/beta hydrolase family protein n=1 Tax=Thermostaphylospora chromogena TaxID=35622 RepID=A0A1H0ZYJ2_9ACTN|nr:hypothetical protein [Thermostaphylospora chromogena]SDQ32478.1 Alpha/beta hydrolase family protein [Thermostaphylospora chromogena]
MRPFEMALVVADLAAFLVLAIPPLRTARFLTPIAPLAAAAQVLAEGARWQLIPAYALAALLPAAWLWPRSGGRRGPEERPGRAGRLGRRLAIGLGAAGLAISAALPSLMPVFRLPQPTGPHGVGTLTYHWTDTDREEIFSSDPGARRELMVQIWYPAQPDPSAPRAPYVSDPEPLTAVSRLAGMPGFTFQYLRQVTTHAVSGAPAVPGRHPVLIFLEGLHGFRQMNTFQAEELASHGYVVVALDQPYTAGAVTFPDGRTVEALPEKTVRPLIFQSVEAVDPPPTLHGRAFPEGVIPHLARDVSFALDRLAALDHTDPDGVLTGRLDLERAGVYGVSLGGVVAAHACTLDSRLDACLIMESPMTADTVRAGLDRPAMWMARDEKALRREGWTQKDIDQHRTMREIYDKLPGPGYFVLLPDTANHVDFTDAPAWSPLLRLIGLAGPIGPEQAHTAINAYTLAFFDKHLKDARVPLLDGPSARHPGIRFESRTGGA